MDSSNALINDIREEIHRCGGQLPFDRFMELALYSPNRGYYQRPQPVFGPDGDFITAPLNSPLFAQCIGRYFAALKHTLGQAALLELGPGSGCGAENMLRYLHAVNALPEVYYLLEVSGTLRAQQEQRLLPLQAELNVRIEWLKGLPEDFSGLIFANEVLDAMPVKRFRWLDDWQEAYVAFEAGAFQSLWGDPSEALKQALADSEMNTLPLPNGYESEMNLWLQPWLSALAASLSRGVVLLVDYGFPFAEYYHPSRHMGTLMCHHRHRAHPDPLIQVGEQDITAHVDFTAVAQAGSQAGLECIGYTTQAHFLMNTGLLEAVAEQEPSLALKNEILMLTSPAEMGELFKVMALAKGVVEPCGFETHNFHHHLSQRPLHAREHD